MTLGIPDYEVLLSGTIIGVPNKLIVFKVKDLVFELEFLTNKENPEQRLEPIIDESGKVLRMKFHNFNNSLGTGNLEPFKLGFVGDKHLYFSYRIYSLAENAGKLLHYTWLLGAQQGGPNG